MAEVLAHWQVLLWNLHRRALAPVVLASHKVDWIYEKGEENRYGVCDDGEVQRNMNSCEYRCVRGRSPRLVFVATKQGGRYLRMCKRQLQLIEAGAPPH